MAINPETQYPGKIAPSTPDYPYGSARNITLPGDGTGTPWEAALVNDLFGWQQALLTEGEVVPSGNPENAGSSQYLSALRNILTPRLNATDGALAKKLTAVPSFTSGGFSAFGDGGGATWRATGNTVPGSAGTKDLDNGLLYDVGGVEFKYAEDVIDARHFGAVGAGPHTSALQSAANFADNGARFSFGPAAVCDDQIIFPNEVNIIYGKLKNSPAGGNSNNPAIWLRGNNSSIDNVDITGEDVAGTYPVLAFSNSGIRVGPETPSVSNFIDGLTIGSNIEIRDMKGEGILLDHVKNFSVGSPNISRIGYAGMILKSCIDGSIQDPTIQDIHDEGAFINHYGITMTRDETTDLTNFPPCTNIQLHKPVIKNVLNWVGLDTHAGVNIDVTWARCYLCKIPFNIQYDSATAGLQNIPTNVTFRGYGSSFQGEADSNEGITILGVSGSQVRDIYIDIVLEHCGDVSNSQNGALNMSEVDGVRGKVRIVNAKRVGVTTVGNCRNVDLEVDIEGVSWTGGSAFYANLQPQNLTNFRLKGKWGEQLGVGDQADIGIFYGSPQVTERDLLLDVEMDVPSGNYISDGAANKYHDMSWVLTDQQQFKKISLAGGTPSETFNVDFPRKFRGAWNSDTLRNDLTTMATIDGTAHPMLTAQTSGILDPDTVVVTLKTLDGSNIQGGGFVVSFTTSAKGIVFDG